MKILIFGVSGMLGHKLLDYFVNNTKYDVRGTIRNKNSIPTKFYEKYKNNFIESVDIFDIEKVKNIILSKKPNVIINAVGVIKQKKGSYVNNIYINSLFPQQIAEICEDNNIKFITIATDCVFKGDLPENESYTENSLSDCIDLYGKSKFLGEVIDKKNTLTIRTSIIGHELFSNYSLIDWFLSQNGEANGFTRAFYSGFPTISLAKIIHQIIENHKNLCGLYQISSEKISKYDLLELVNKIYGKNIKLNKNIDFYMNRVLNCDKFKKETNISINSWQFMINEMFNDFKNNDFYKEKNVK